MATYVLAFYEIDREYGGPEEGGWWYNTGRLVRVSRIVKSKELAYKLCARANALLERFERGKRSVGSVLYNGGRHACEVYENVPPAYYPETRPYYE